MVSIKSRTRQTFGGGITSVTVINAGFAKFCISVISSRADSIAGACQGIQIISGVANLTFRITGACAVFAGVIAVQTFFSGSVFK